MTVECVTEVSYQASPHEETNVIVSKLVLGFRQGGAGDFRAPGRLCARLPGTWGGLSRVRAGGRRGLGG